MTALLNDSNSITFAVDDVSPASRRLNERPMHEAMKTLLGDGIESCSDYHSQVVSDCNYHPLLQAVYTAHAQHYPLSLTPESVWITIAQGIANHMMVHAERLRERFVSHKGQIDLQVVVDDWVAKSPENPWQDAFASWTDQIREHVGTEIYECLLCDFSTSGPLERAVSQVVMMDVFQRYFRYEIYAVCGIPTITLQGSVSDWQKLRDKVESLAIFDIDWWLDELRMICDQFVAARRGEVNLEHWKNICKLTSAYGGDIINGWVIKLFPYVRAFTNGPCTRVNPIFDSGEGVTTGNVPSGLSKVPFTWTDARTQEQRPMELLGGLSGITQDDQDALKPMLGWVVREVNSIDALMFRLKNEQKVAWHSSQPKSAYDESDPWNSRSYLPADLERLYFDYASVEIYSHGESIEVIPNPEQQSVDWGEDSEKSLGSRGPDGRTWYKFATLSDGRYCLINLDINCRDPRKEMAYDRSFAPICICSDASVGSPKGNPVVAYSLTDWLTKSLDWARQNDPDGTFYWDEPKFHCLGEAQSFVRVD